MFDKDMRIAGYDVLMLPDGSDDRLAAFFKHGHALLQMQDVQAQVLAHGCGGLFLHHGEAAQVNVTQSLDKHLHHGDSQEDAQSHPYN